MKSLNSFGKALSDPTRVRILNALMAGELCVCELVDALEIGQSTISTHLLALKSMEVLKSEKRRTWIIYSIEPDVRPALELLFSLFDISSQRIERDLQRLSLRMLLRVDGCCVLGGEQLGKELVNV